MNVHNFLVLLHQLPRELAQYLQEWITLCVHDELNTFPGFTSHNQLSIIHNNEITLCVHHELNTFPGFTSHNQLSTIHSNEKSVQFY